MDNKGFMIGQSTRVKVIDRKVGKHMRKTQDGNQEMITVLEPVSTAGRLQMAGEPGRLAHLHEA